MQHFEVGVIGAGIHGTSVAYHLGSRGISTVLFERDAPAQGPTGRSSGICRAYYTNPFLAGVARESIGMFECFEEITGHDAGFRRTGFLFLQGPGEADQVHALHEVLEAVRVATEVLEPDALAARFPAFDLSGIGLGVWEPGAGYADAAAATVGFFRRANDLGVVARLGEAVIAIEVGDRGTTLVTSSGARTSCAKVLIAAGPWTRPLASQVGVDLPLSVERHAVSVFGWGAGEPVVAHADVAAGYYLRLDGMDQYLAGWLHPAPAADPDHFAATVADHEVEALATAVVNRVPRLGASVIQSGWASLYDVSPDWQPMIGKIAPGVFVDAGTSGHGFKLAPALGRHVADLVMGESAEAGMEEFDPFRFEHGRSLAAGFGQARILG
jgi:glycine/D-amino acid oxidase-like deaminating enzyme